VSTDTSAICTPPTPAELRPPGFLGSLVPVSEIVCAPSLAQAAPSQALGCIALHLILPSTAEADLWERPARATASNSLSNALTVALRGRETPPIVVDTGAVENGNELSPITTHGGER
jgi:hypothetical protein